MDLIGLAVISLYFIGRECSQNYLIFYYYFFFLVYIIGIDVMQSILLILKFLDCTKLVFFQRLIPERQGKLDNKTNEMMHIYPPCCLGVIFFPSFDQALDIITRNCSRVLLFSIFKTLDDSGHRQVHNQPCNYNCESQEIYIREARPASLRNHIIAFHDKIVLVFNTLPCFK